MKIEARGRRASHLASHTALTHYFACPSGEEPNGSVLEVRSPRSAESNSGGAIIPNVEPFHPLGVVARVNFTS